MKLCRSQRRSREGRCGQVCLVEQGGAFGGVAPMGAVNPPAQQASDGQGNDDGGQRLGEQEVIVVGGLSSKQPAQQLGGTVGDDEHQNVEHLVLEYATDD